MLKKGAMPTVHVINVLFSKVFCPHCKDDTHADGDRSRGEDVEIDAEDDPMALLVQCAPEADLDTPKKKQ